MRVVASGSELSDMQRCILSSALEWIPCRLQTQLESFQVGFSFKCILSLFRVERCSLALTLSLRYWKPAAERLPEVCVCQDHPLPPIKPHSLFKESIINNKRYFTGACLSCSLSLPHVLFGSFIPLSFTPSPFRIVYASLHPAFSPHAGFSQVTLLHSRRGQWYDRIVLDTQSSRKIPTPALMMLQGNSAPSTSVTWSAQACVLRAGALEQYTALMVQCSTKQHYHARRNS